MYYVKETKEFGRGLYAGITIYRRQVLMRCELLVFNNEDSMRINETLLKYYTFVFDSERDCLVLGDGELFNHDDKANVGYRLESVPGSERMQMVFYALKDIQANEQLFIDYSADAIVDLEQYFNTESML